MLPPPTVLGSPPLPQTPHLAAPTPVGRCNTRWGRCRPCRVTAPALPPRWPTPPPCCWAPGPSPSTTDWLRGDTGSVRGPRALVALGWGLSWDVAQGAWGGLAPMGAVAPGLPPRLPATAHFGAARCPWVLQDKGPRIQSPWGDGPHPWSGGWPGYRRCSLFIPLAPFITLKKNRLKHHVLGGLRGGGGGEVLAPDARTQRWWETQRCWTGGGGGKGAGGGMPAVPRGGLATSRLPGGSFASSSGRPA